MHVNVNVNIKLHVNLNVNVNMNSNPSTLVAVRSLRSSTSSGKKIWMKTKRKYIVLASGKETFKPCKI